ncbi:uncharacterized protein LOC113496480 [Trichoplusia ni]|uniref:Uncharacterized protein LOC113496480 n=1 Tax=Trichoplusia ni TaxID=7111 RepID=A0A7E5VTQ6_TRINI|nr:uncharacterized protein LOC113496480 [Trichoplusia ni]
MSFLDGLPHVETCCFCCSLKIGSIIIAGLRVLNLVEVILFFFSSDSFECVTGLMVTIITWINVVFTVALVLTAIYFLFGIVKGWPDTAVWFMYVSALFLIFEVVGGISLCFAEPKEDCPPPWIYGVSTIFSCLLELYFLIVIKSYHRVMLLR